MFCTDVKNVRAAIRHKCTSCGEFIEPGEIYKNWRSCDDAWTVNKMHPECLEAHLQNAKEYGESEWEYSIYDHQRGKADLK